MLSIVGPWLHECPLYVVEGAEVAAVIEVVEPSVASLPLSDEHPAAMTAKLTAAAAVTSPIRRLGRSNIPCRFI